MILAPGPPLTPKHKKVQKTPFTYPSTQSPRYPYIGTDELVLLSDESNLRNN